MTVERNGEKVELKDVDLLTTKKSADDDTPQLRIDFYIEPLEKNFGTVISRPSRIRCRSSVWYGAVLIGLVTGQFSPQRYVRSRRHCVGDHGGRVREPATSGFGSAVSSIVYVMMVITINLGVVNMLPFPALDGGRFLMLLIEAIFRKPVPRKVESIINTVGLVLLLGLIGGHCGQRTSGSYSAEDLTWQVNVRLLL